MTSYLKVIFQAFLKDKSYVLNACIVLLLMIVLLLQHDWNLKPNFDVSLEENVFDSKSELPDFSIIKNTKEKKVKFFEFLRPKIRRANQKIKYQQVLLKKLTSEIESKSYHTDNSKKKLIRLGVSYGLKKENVLKQLDELSIRIDIIPEALVLAQAANESAWGTSRFSVQANNLFGQWCFTKGCGLVPKNRNSDAKHEVQKFSSTQSSVTSYMKNLNSNRAYRSLRAIRSSLRQQGRVIKGIKLAQGLKSYSERGDAYVEEIIKMIRQNQLE